MQQRFDSFFLDVDMLHICTLCCFQMVELSPGSRVYAYQTHVDVASKKQPSAAACFLLSCFFSNSELIGANLTGANGKKRLSTEIINAIVGKFVCNSVFLLGG